MKARILGSGTSSGVPRIGNDWGECDPAEPRNHRSRAALLIEHEGTRILVDTGPDMRTQLLAADVATIDAVIWTHDHADHTAGIDDLRQVYHALGRPVRGYARRATYDVLMSRYGYVFAGAHSYPPTVTLEVLPDRLGVGPVTVDTVDQPHADIYSAGLRFTVGDAAIGYATDFSEMTRDMLSLYENLDVWVVDALRRRPHPSHPELARVLGWIERLRPGRAALVHMDQSMDYQTLLAELPAGVEPGYDGMELAA